MKIGSAIKKYTFVAGFALTGFFVSFIAGLFSQRRLSSILLLALVFAAVFALLGFAIRLLLSNVLSVDSPPRGRDATQDTGNVVDIVVKDEELPGEKDAPSFHVGENRQMLHKDDYGGGTVSGGVDTIHEVRGNAAAPEKKAADAQGGGSAQSGGAVADGSGKEADSAKYNPRDELPSFDNLDDIAAEDDSGAQSAESEIAGLSFEPKHERSGSGKTLSEADTALMAKAISTVLAKDKD